MEVIAHKNIHEAINAVMQEVGYVQKQKADTLKYTYAGEASLIEALRPSMVKHGLYMYLYHIEKIYRDAYTTKTGTAMVNSLIHCIIRFTHVSGEFIDVEATGEGADSGDKSANKALTGAYKYALRQTFCIETGDDPDRFPSEDFERSELPGGKKNTPKQAQEAPEPQETGATTNPEPETVKTAVEGSAKTYTGNQVFADTDLVKKLSDDTHKTVVEVCKVLNTLEKGKKFALAEIHEMILKGAQ